MVSPRDFMLCKDTNISSSAPDLRESIHVCSAGDAESAATDYMLALELEQAGVCQGKPDKKHYE
jgi:hypothetical protein